MKVIKNINNNVSLCLDSNQHEVVAFGKGIGFTKPPYEIDLSKVERTFYDVDELYLNMIKDIPREMIDISTKVIDYARMKIENPISSNVIFTLADHINFTIERYRKNMDLKLSIVQDIRYLYETEMEIAEYAVKLIRRETGIRLPEEETGCIALHIINAEAMDRVRRDEERRYDEIIDSIVEIIEEDFHFKVDKKDFNYSRFTSHMHYLFLRVKKNELCRDKNSHLYESLKASYPEIYECSEKVRKFLSDSLQKEMTDEECMYLILHINRLCSREDCYR